MWHGLDILDAASPARCTTWAFLFSTVAAKKKEVWLSLDSTRAVVIFKP
jgi:hypothetical protein